MCVYVRLTGIATLLIGLLLFSQKVVDAKVKFDGNHGITSKTLFVASNPKVSEWQALVNPVNQEFEPLDNGGPGNTRGSGTR